MTKQLIDKELETDFRALPQGTELQNGQYRIDSYLSSGGFGITYLATDSLGRRVVIKECFPEALCHRPDQTVQTKNSHSIKEFNTLVDMFVREARSLAKLDHPNIVGVHQIFEANDTAYMVLDFVNGHDAMQLLDNGSAPFAPDRVVTLTKHLLEAISAVHNADMLHRDISPDNILIDQDGKPCLIDFGAARQEATQKSRAISTLMVVKDGYSPQEFYISGGQQGPASDLYSLGATLFHMITGKAPPNSQSRLAALAAKRPDPYQPLTARVDGYAPNFLRAIDMAMNVFPKDRPQSAQDWAAIISDQPRGDTNDDPQVRKVISALVTEVAMSIAEAAEIEAQQRRAPAEPDPVAPLMAPEDDPWWPLTEPIEDREPQDAAPDLIEADLIEAELVELSDTGTDAAPLEDPEPAIDAFAVPENMEPAPETVPVADPEPEQIAKTDPNAEVETSELPDDASARRTRRRVSALVLIAALTIVFQQTVPANTFSATLTSLGSFVGAVMAGEAQI